MMRQNKDRVFFLGSLSQRNARGHMVLVPFMTTDNTTDYFCVLRLVWAFEGFLEDSSFWPWDKALSRKHITFKEVSLRFETQGSDSTELCCVLSVRARGRPSLSAGKMVRR